MDGYRSERSVAAALREQFPWLGERRLFDAGLARRLAQFGFYLMK